MQRTDQRIGIDHAFPQLIDQCAHLHQGGHKVGLYGRGDVLGRVQPVLGVAAGVLQPGDVEVVAPRGDFLELALADEGRGPDLRHQHERRADDIEIDGLRQAHGLVEPGLGRAMRLRVGLFA